MSRLPQAEILLALVSIGMLAGAVALSTRGSSNANHRWMSLRAVLATEPAAAKAGVSDVARGARGFLRAYEDAKGDPERMADIQSKPSQQPWDRRRAGFISRHMAQIENRDEALWTVGRDGSRCPSRRHLALMMWAHTPTPELTESWLQRQGYRGPLWA